MTDPHFRATVTLVLQHGTEGAFGLVLNRTTDKPFADLWHRVRGTVTSRKDRVRAGGPVDGGLLVLHGDEGAGDVEVLSGVFVCTRADGLQDLLDGSVAPMRFFAGYAGWGRGQLEAELQTGSWLTTTARAEHVFPEDEDDMRLWQAAFQEVTAARMQPPGFESEDPDPTAN